MKCKVCNEEMRLSIYDDSQPYVEYYYYECPCGMCFGTTIQNGKALGNEWFNAIKKLKETEEIKKKIDDFYLEKRGEKNGKKIRLQRPMWWKIPFRRNETNK